MNVSRKSRGSALVSCLLITLAMLCASVAIPASASAASCYANSCTGYDPIDAGCASDAQTVLSNGVVGQFLIELRYSPTCNAYWARATIYAPNDDSSNDAVIYGWTCPSSCSTAGPENSGVYASHTVYSNMISGSYWVQACTGFLVDHNQVCTDIGGAGQGPR